MRVAGCEILFDLIVAPSLYLKAIFHSIIAGLKLVEQLCGGKFLDSANIPIRVGSQEILIDPENFSSVKLAKFHVDCGSAG